MYPKWNNTLSSKLILGFLNLLLDNAKVDYKELESIFVAPRGIRRLRAPHSFTPAATRLPLGLPGEDPRTPSRRLRLRGLGPIVFQSSDNQAVKKALVPNPFFS